MRKVTIMGPKLLHGHEVYLEGDVTHFEDDVAADYIARGWVSDFETGETGTRVPGAAGTVQVHNADIPA